MSTKPFANLKPTAANHFKLCFYGAVLHAMEQLARSLGSAENVLERFPFLSVYCEEVAGQGVGGIASCQASRTWQNAVEEWEKGLDEHLPLKALAEVCGLDRISLLMLLVSGLTEEDSRFGYVFETAQGVDGQAAITIGLLQAWFGGFEDARSRVRRLEGWGLLRAVAGGARNASRGLQVPPILWDALRGESIEHPAEWATHRKHSELPKIDELVLPDELARRARGLTQLISAKRIKCIVVRGPRHNVRGTLLAAIARETQRGVLEIREPLKADAERWRQAGILCTLLRAMPVLRIESAPGEKSEVPEMRGCEAPLGIVLERGGTVSGTVMERAVTLAFGMPDEPLREEIWDKAMKAEGATGECGLRTASRQLRLTSGNIWRTARLAASHAQLGERKEINKGDLDRAVSELNYDAMEALAQEVRARGDWGDLSVAAHTQAELESLENRCLHREWLAEGTRPAFRTTINAGVRAMFSGPSGTGKTLAAQVLAARLHKALYRLDLSIVVNKYIGETEKNLSRVFARAEELDLVLLLDEGDSLLTQRTSVQTSNDRYANLETNYLLQRVETFEGILIVTTNAADRIDRAFQRRMDVVVDFRPPEAAERWGIWQMHLPAKHAVDETFLSEVAGRCVMTGGQIRNAMLHASLLARSDSAPMTSAHLESAVQREYRKIGAVCPLRATGGFGLPRSRS